MHASSSPLLMILMAGIMIPAQAQRVIRIEDQQGFDNLQQRIEKAAYAGEKNISVLFAPGTYYFTDKHLKLYGKDWGDVHLTLSGPGSIFTAAGTVFRDGDPCPDSWDPGWQFLRPDGTAFPTFGESVRSPGLVKIVDEGQKLCKIRMPGRESRPAARCKDTYIQLTRWYESRLYKVSRIRDGWVYFIADDLERVSPLGYNVNYDFLYGQKTPRFRLCNAGAQDCVRLEDGRIRLPDRPGSAHCCQAANFLNIHNSDIGSITLSGLEFRGNAGLSQNHLIGAYDCRCRNFSVRDCKFSDIKSSVFSAEYTDHIEFRNNTFSNCAVHVLSTAATCRNARFFDNRFDRCGSDWGPWACIIACGDDYRISGNRISNFGYVGIFVGGMESMLAGKEPGGIIEDNTLWYDPPFLEDTLTRTMMDSGAIYISVCNDVATVRRNYIHDIGGVKDNRGIFCDDGARNFDIYDNVILNIVNSYSIDSRRVPEAEGARIRHNVGNKIHDNLVDSSIRFEGNETGDRCSLGSNYILRGQDGSSPSLHIRNISQEEPQRNLTSLQGTPWEAMVK